jgi:hypothetical protein
MNRMGLLNRVGNAPRSKGYCLQDERGPLGTRLNDFWSAVDLSTVEVSMNRVGFV